MRNAGTMKFAASGLVLGLTIVGCKPGVDMARPASAASVAQAPEKDAAKAFADAQAFAQKSNYAAAVESAERAVALSPRDAGYRSLLGDLYLKSGRFQSAESAFADVLTLDQQNRKAGLSLVLARIAQGKTGAALGMLDELSSNTPAADLGLAYALAGQPRRAIQILEPAARAIGANARVRQNLALAYALAGEWQKARVTAAQDVAPAELNQRMEQWASFAKPASSYTQVATLLGVNPANDPGQPARLALVEPQATAPQALAQAEPAPAPAPAAIASSAAAPAPASAFGLPAPAPEPAPVRIAQAEPVPAPVAVAPAPQPAPVTVAPEPAPVPVKYAQAAQTFFQPQQAPVRAARPSFVRKATLDLPHAAPKHGLGRFVVQIGAFSSEGQVEKAWASAVHHYRFADANQPLSTTVRVGGGTFHRLSVAGFDNRSAAAQLCSSIKAHHGVCFVRTIAGDAPVRWASRYARRA